MTEIVFNDPVEGAMKLASYYYNDISNKIISLPLELSVGNLQKGVLSDERYHQVHSWFADDPWLDDDGYYFTEEMQKEHKKIVEALLEQLKEETEIRIWYDYTTDSLCGFYHFISMIKDYDVKIHAVCFNDHPKYRLQYKGLGSVEPDLFIDLLQFGIDLTPIERRFIERTWQEIEQTQCSFRICLNGQIMPVPEDFLDNYIKYYIPKSGSFNAHTLVGDMLGYTPSVDYNFLMWRTATVLHKMNYEPVRNNKISENAPALAKFIFNSDEAGIAASSDTAFYDWIDMRHHNASSSSYYTSMAQIDKLLQESVFNKTDFFKTIASLSDEQLKYVNTYLYKTKKENGKLTPADLRLAHVIAIRKA